MGIRNSSHIKIVRGRGEAAPDIETAVVIVPAAPKIVKSKFVEPSPSDDWEATLWWRTENRELDLSDHNGYNNVVAAESADLQNCTPLPLEARTLRQMENLPRSVKGELDHRETRQVLDTALGDKELVPLEKSFKQAITMACASAGIMTPGQKIARISLTDVYPSGDGRLIFELKFNAKRPAEPGEEKYSTDSLMPLYRGEVLLSYVPGKGGGNMIAHSAYLNKFKYSEKQNEICKLHDRAHDWVKTDGHQKVAIAGDFISDSDDESMNHWDRFAAKRVQSKVRSSAREIFGSAGFLPPGGHDFKVEDDLSDFRHSWKKNVFTGKYSGTFDLILNDVSNDSRYNRINPVIEGVCKVSQIDDGIEMKFDFAEPKSR